MQLKANRRVVITGIGVVSGFGLTKNDFWSGISQGKSAIKALKFEEPLKMQFGYTLEGYDPNQHFDSKNLPLLDRFSQLAMIAAWEAFAESGLPANIKENTAVIIGSGNGGKHTDEEGYYKLYKQGKSRVHPFMIPKGMHSAVASNVSRSLALNGITYTIASACSSGAHAISHGADLVATGRADAAMVGGSDAPFAYGILKAWDALRVITNDQCRPFSKDRKGIILGEGAAIFTIEPLEAALKRKANIYAEIAGAGVSSDAGHITDPDIKGIELSITRALTDAEVSPEDIDYINAHGTGTTVNDRTETQAIKNVFGDYAMNPVVSSTKPMHGHALGASSAMEIAATAMAMKNSLIPPLINYREKDDNCDLQYIIDEPLNKKITTAMSNSFAFGGLNAVIVLKAL